MNEFVVPERFNKNSPDVRAMGSPTLTGKVLLDYMAARLGWEGLAGKRVLDIGCGSRFASTIRTYDIPVQQYIGVDVDREMIEWLQQNAALANISFHFADQRHPLYNPAGAVIGPDWSFADHMDVCCMFSVITHTQPADALDLFREAHKRVAPAGSLFFSACIIPAQEDYQELGKLPGEFSAYSRPQLVRLLTEARWYIVSEAPPNPPFAGAPIIPPILDSFVCKKTD